MTGGGSLSLPLGNWDSSFLINHISTMISSKGPNMDGMQDLVSSSIDLHKLIFLFFVLADATLPQILRW